MIIRELLEKVLISLGFCFWASGCLVLPEGTNPLDPKRTERTIPTEPEIELTLLDVGQGESILITCPNDKRAWLIDAGTTNSLYPGGEELFSASLKSRNLPKQTPLGLIITHTDPDHIGGLSKLSKSQYFKIDSFYLRGELPEEVAHLRLPLPEEIPSSLELCPNSLSTLKLQLIELSKAGKKALSCPANLNDCSAVFYLKHKNFSILLMGDGTLALENQLLKEGKVPRAKILKIGHHASLSSGREFLQAVSPEIAAYSAGVPSEKGNSVDKWGYPRLKDIERLNQFFNAQFNQANDLKREVQVCEFLDNSCIWRPAEINSRILPTSVWGSISFRTDGDSLSISGSRQNEAKNRGRFELPKIILSPDLF